MNTTSNIHHLSARHANSNNPMTIRSSSPSVVLNTAASGVSPATTTVCEGGGIPSDAYMSAASVSSAVDANNALQAAYLALQTQNQLQRQQQLSEMSAYAAFPLLNSSSNAGLSQSLTSAEATERLLAAQASLLAAQSGANISPNSLLSAAALLQQQPPPDAASSSVSVCSSTSCSASPSMAVCPAANVAASSRQTSSAFSPIRAIGNPITSTAPSRPTQQYAAPPSSSPSTTTTTTTTTPSLDMMLLQMQMAAAAAGLVQTPFNLLAPSNLNASATNTALVNSLLAPHLRLQQSSATASGLSPSVEAALSNASFTGDCTVSSLAQQPAVAAAVSANPSNATNQLMTQPQNLFEQSSLNNLSNSNSHNGNSMTSLLARPSSSMPGSPSKPNETSPIPLPRCYSMGKQQYHPQHHHQPQPQQQQQQKQFQLKRPHHSISNSNDMAVLRSLCNDTETPEVTPPVKRRTKTIACCDSELDRRLLAAEVMASGLKEMTPSMEHRPRRSGNNTYRFLNDFHHRSGNRKSSNADGALSSSSYSTTSMSVSNPKVNNNNNNNIPTTSSSNAECNQQIPSGDPNSPNRHHPLNHQPPAMEARFLECMAAIVLHSDFSIPTTSSPSSTEESNSSASPPNQNDTSDSQRQQQQQLNKYDSLQSPKSATNEAAQSESNEHKISDEDVPLEIDQHSPKCPKSDNMQTDDGDDDDDIRIIDDSDLFVIKDDAEKQDQSQENGTKNHKDSKGSTPINQQNDSESGDDIDMEPTDTTTTTTTTTESTQQQQQQQQKLTERLLHKSEKRTWPTTAIDDELCKELENYKGTDVKMIHAYVIPPRSDTSSSSGDSLEDRGQSPPFHSVPSLAVPVPILNILLERILHTMLQT